jgi:putative ABC transport system permease protein
MNALDQKLLRDLSHHRAQVIAISLVVACGIAMFVSLRSNYHSLLASQTSYYRSYRFADVFVQVKRAPLTVATKVLEIPGVGVVQSRIVQEITLDIPGLQEPATGRLISIPDNPVPILNDVYIRQGSYPDALRSDEVLVSSAFAEANQLKVGEAISGILNGRWKKLRIVGIAISPEYIYEIRGSEILPDNRRFGVLWMNRTPLAEMYNMEGAFNDLAITLGPGASKREFIARLDRLLEPYGGLGAYGREDQLSHNFIKGEIDETSITSTVVPAIFLAVASFLINIVLSRLVSMQRNQIGLLKAFGYSNSTIATHFLKFAIISVVGGTLVGVAAGLWIGFKLATLYTRFFHFPIFEYSIGAGLLLFGFLISILSAAIGAISAVKKSIKLPPAEAMRPEPPANFHSGKLEQLGLARMVSIPFRMILRNLARRPVKASLSMLGIGLAVAIMVVGLYFFDAFDHLIRLQFTTIQREDVTVLLQNNLGANAIHAISRLPGVLTAEPYTAVAARLRHEHRSKRIAILGLPRDGTLRQIVDQRFRKVSLPTEGIVLTDVLAEQLGVAAGEKLTVEVLEGSRPRRDISLTAVVDEPIGLSAYMNIDALNRMLAQGPIISGCFLSVDASALPQLYSALKKMPAVSGVSIKRAMVSSFQETIAESFRISLNMLVFFACLIAFSIVYNGARIALSERGHELASLRVLGFTRQEISWMLLGEQFLLMILATPLGFLIGYGICVLVTRGTASDLYRFPVILTSRTYFLAFFVTLVSTLASGSFVLRRIRRLDLVEVLKTKE